MKVFEMNLIQDQMDQYMLPCLYIYVSPLNLFKSSVVSLHIKLCVVSVESSSWTNQSCCEVSVDYVHLIPPQREDRNMKCPRELVLCGSLKKEKAGLEKTNGSGVT